MAAGGDDAFVHCRRLIRQADKDRYWASLYAPADKRDALYALFAFDLEIGRIAAVVREPMAGEIRLQWWREAIEGKRAEERAGHPVAAALLQTIAACDLPRARLLALIDAHGADLYEEPVDAENYGAATRGTIFAVAAKILGGEGALVDELARHAGIGDESHRAAAAALLPRIATELLPAFLPAATLGRKDLPLWRRQYLIWRAARDPRRIFA
jgi:phytoene synthase